jgi:6,7-dimethyl-8-ribityllumazine synthase
MAQKRSEAVPKVYEGGLSASGLTISIVVSRFNDFFSQRLVEGAIDALTRSGADPSTIELVKVPGAFEIPTAVRWVLGRKVDAVICLGVLIRGETPHFDLIAAEVTKGMAALAMETGTPVIDGVVVAETLDQAVERSGSKMGNKGFGSAMAAIEMANLARAMRGR